MRNGEKGPRLGPVALVIGFLVASCSFYAPPVVFNNPYDANQDTTSEIARRTITVDGNPADWSNILPMKLDAQSDWDNPDVAPSGMDISAVFLAQDSTYLYWRMDVWDGPLSTTSSFSLYLSRDIAGGRDVIGTGYNSDGSSYTNVDHFDSSDNWLSTDNIAVGSVAIATVVEGRIPLSVVSAFNGANMGFSSNYYNDTTGDSAYDNAGDFDLNL